MGVAVSPYFRLPRPPTYGTAGGHSGYFRLCAHALPRRFQVGKTSPIHRRGLHPSYVPTSGICRQVYGSFLRIDPHLHPSALSTRGGPIHRRGLHPSYVPTSGICRQVYGSFHRIDPHLHRRPPLHTLNITPTPTTALTAHASTRIRECYAAPLSASSVGCVA